jgi:hypothetical protein
LQQACTALDIRLAGGVFPQLVIDGVLQKRGIVLFRLPGPPGIWMITDPGEPRAIEQCCQAVADALRVHAERRTAASLLLLFDAMLPNVASLLESIFQQLADGVRYMGANAGSETFKPMPCLFDNDRLLGNAILVVLLPGHEGAVLEHGYRPPDHVMTATSSTGNCVTTINWQPAFDVYRQLVSRHYGVEVTPDNFYEHAVHFPFGILRMDGGVLVRIPVALTPEGALYCVGEVPPNAVLTLLQGPEPGSDETVTRIVEQLGQEASEALLLFYCAGRRVHLGEGASAELRALSERTGREARGALSLGEISGCRGVGYPLFHNAAIVCVPWKAR